MIQAIKTSKWVIVAVALLCLSNSSFAQSKTSSSAFEINDKALKEYAGDYKTEDSNYFNITISITDKDKLMAQPTDKSEPITLLVATKKDYFDLAQMPSKIRFNRAENGTIESLTFSQGSVNFTAKRLGRS
jgi:uncharacterized protein DUF3471